VGNLLRGITRDSLTLNAEMNALMHETLNVSGALLVKIFGRDRDENARFKDRARMVRDIGIRQALVGRWFFLGLSLVGAAGTAIVFWVGGHLVLSGVFTVGILVQFGMYVTQLYGPLSALTNARVEFATSMVSFERVFEVLDLPEEITERPNAVTLNNVSGSVSFEDVSFSYLNTTNLAVAQLPTVSRMGHPGAVNNDDYEPVLQDAGLQTGKSGDVGREDRKAAVLPRWALRHLSFKVGQGQLAALVGPSGSGKTTITYLLPRLYDPSEGRILVDGHDLRDVTLRSLSQQIGMVTQETYLFHNTLRQNLLYAKPNATLDELADAARVANLSEVIANMPDGLDTIVGERGYRLSGGEKQRVAIARVILKDPRILILDEATSHLDSQSEALIQNALERVMLGRTSLVIAHRLSTILSADLILVMDNGRLVESGTHASLLDRGGLYAQLYETQLRRGPSSADGDH
jgi:ATP-binding cassette subfamily B protein